MKTDLLPIKNLFLQMTIKTKLITSDWKVENFYFYWTSAHKNWPAKQMVSFTNSRMRILNFYWNFSNESKLFAH